MSYLYSMQKNKTRLITLQHVIVLVPEYCMTLHNTQKMTFKSWNTINFQLKAYINENERYVNYSAT